MNCVDVLRFEIIPGNDVQGAKSTNLWRENVWILSLCVTWDPSSLATWPKLSGASSAQWDRAIIIIIISRPKPLSRRQGLAGGIVGPGYSQMGTFGAQLGLDIVLKMWLQFLRVHFGRAHLLGLLWKSKICAKFNKGSDWLSDRARQWLDFVR